MNFRSSAGAQANRRGVVVDLTALIDVVFQLLIFFLLTSTYVRSQAAQVPQVPVDLPETSLQAQAQPLERLNLVIDSSGAVLLDSEEPLGLEALTAKLLETKQRNPQTMVLSRGDENVPYGRVAEVMGIIRTVNLPVSAVLQNAE